MGKEEKKNKGGRPSKYDTIDIKEVEKLAGLGLTNEQIAGVLNINPDTLYSYQKDKPEFSEALKRGKKISDDRVERSLYERAIGYSHPEDKIMQYEGMPIIVPTVKHYPPDPVSAIFWLKNRKPEEWRDKQETINTGEHTIKIVYAKKDGDNSNAS